MTAQPERLCAHCGQPVPADQAWTVAFIAPRDNGSERAAQRELGVVHLDCAAPYLEPLAAPTTSPATPGEGGISDANTPARRTRPRTAKSASWASRQMQHRRAPTRPEPRARGVTLATR
jgi:5-methylcytosine-specific restriction endonuclease McrA